MKKVLILSKNLQPGGAERQLVYLAKLLSSRFSVFFMVYERKGVFIEELESWGIPIITQEQRSVWGSSRDLRRVIRNSNYDVVVTFLPECNLISELATIPFKRWRVITGARSANPQFITNPRLRIYYYAHLLADIVISNSETNKNDILKVNKLLRENKIQVVYNVFNPAKCVGSYLPFRNNRINIVVAANFRTVKNLDGLLKALVLLDVEQRGQIHIDWYGLEVDGSYSSGNAFIHTNNLENTISLHPSTDKIYEVLNESDVVGLFSHYEGLPNSLCEALVQGKMVICTPVSDMPLLLNKTDNIVVASDSAEDIKRGFVELLETSRERILSSGSHNAIRFTPIFDVENIHQQLLRLILD